MTIEELANEEFEFVGNGGLFPNHTDKDIWISGFKNGYKLALEKEWNRLTVLVKLYKDTSKSFSYNFDSFIESIEQNIIDIEKQLGTW